MKEKNHRQNLKRFSGVFEKGADNEVLTLTGEGLHFKYLI